MRLDDMTFVITGAARGIGAATARTAAARGAAVVVADLDDDAGSGPSAAGGHRQPGPLSGQRGIGVREWGGLADRLPGGVRHRHPVSYIEFSSVLEGAHAVDA